MFADDTLIHVTGESITELKIKMNMAFIIVKENINKLKMNMAFIIIKENINKLKMNKGKYMIVESIRKELRGNITL